MAAIGHGNLREQEGTSSVHAKCTSFSFRRGVLLALLAVALFAFCMPGRPFPWMAWVALVPLFLALRNATPIRGFLLAGLTGWLMWLTSTWWLFGPLRDLVGLSAPGAVVFTMGVCLLMCAPYALAGAVVAWRPGRSGVLGSGRDAAVFTLAITWLTPVFQGNIAHTQYRFPLVLQVLEIGGTPLLLFLILWVNWLLADAVSSHQRAKALPWKTLVASAAIVGVIVVFGFIRMRQLDAKIKSAAPERLLTVGAVQPNIPIPVALGRQPVSHASSNNFFTALDQARDLVRRNPQTDLIVFPENPATFLFNHDSERRQALGQLITDTGKPVILNVDAVDLSVPSENSERYNVAALVDAGRNLTHSYTKIKRIPFAEYVPGETLFPWMRKWFPKSQRVLKGPGPVVFEVKPGIRVMPLICYEGTISSFTRRFVDLGGNIIVNQVNDSWFLRTSASETHLALALFRAVEYRVPLVRVTNSGIGAHIQADGSIVPGSRTPLFTETTTVFPLYVPPSRSIYAWMGDWWLPGLLLLVPAFRARTQPGSPA